MAPKYTPLRYRALVPVGGYLPCKELADYALFRIMLGMLLLRPESHLLRLADKVELLAVLPRKQRLRPYLRDFFRKLREHALCRRILPAVNGPKAAVARFVAQELRLIGRAEEHAAARVLRRAPAVRFAESKPGRTALIPLLEKARDGIAGRTGTAVSQAFS